MNESTAARDGGNNGKEGEVVDIEAGEGHGVDFVDRGDEVGFSYGEIDEASATVVGEVFGGFVDSCMHGFQDFEFDFEEFDGSAGNGDFRFGGKSGSNEAHGFDGVFGDVVVNVLTQEGAALDNETSGTDARNLNAETF